MMRVATLKSVVTIVGPLTSRVTNRSRPMPSKRKRPLMSVEIEGQTPEEIERALAGQSLPGLEGKPPAPDGSA